LEQHSPNVRAPLQVRLTFGPHCAEVLDLRSEGMEVVIPAGVDVVDVIGLEVEVLG